MRATATMLTTVAMALGAIGLAVAAPGGADLASARVQAASGAVHVSNSRAGQAVIDASDVRPGDSTTGTVTIGNDGDAAGTFLVAVTDLQAGMLSEAVAIEIGEAGAGAPRYDGPLDELDQVGLGTLAPGAERTFQVRLTLADTAGNELQGAQLTFGLQWRATTVAAATPTPAPETPRPPTNPTTPTTPTTPSTPSTPATPTAPSRSAADAIGLPAATSCVKSGKLKLRLKGPNGSKVVSATVSVNGRVKAKLKGATAGKAVSLRGLKKSTKLKVSLKASDGRTYKASRTYRACKR
jgi:spore coat-associated protein N